MFPSMVIPFETFSKAKYFWFYSHPEDNFAHGSFLTIPDWTCHHTTLLCQMYILQGWPRFGNWLSVWYVVPWTNHLGFLFVIDQIKQTSTNFSTKPFLYWYSRSREFLVLITQVLYYQDNKVHGAHMGTAWVLSAPDGPHVGPINLAIRVALSWLIVSQSTMESNTVAVFILK